MKTRTSKFILFFTALALLVPTLFCTASATNAMPTTETEGIVDGGLYYIRNISTEIPYLKYHPNLDEVYCTNDWNVNERPINLDMLFRVCYLENGTYTLIPMGWHIARLQADGEKLTVALPNDSPEQRWYIIPCEGGYEIRSAAGDHPAIGMPTQVIGWDEDFFSDAAKNRVWSFESVSEPEVPENRVYVKAPAHWRPGIILASGDGLWRGNTIIDLDADGWYSFPNPANPSAEFGLYNAFVEPPGLNSFHDWGWYLPFEAGKDYWIVVHDDPNVDGDLSVSIYDSKPENLPETADPTALAPAAAALIVSTLALLVSVKLKPKEL